MANLDITRFIASSDQQKLGGAPSLLSWFIASSDQQKLGGAPSLSSWFIASSDQQSYVGEARGQELDLLNVCGGNFIPIRL